MSRAAQYAEKVRDFGSSSQYLYKAGYESMGGLHKKSSYSAKRVSIRGLMEKIAETNNDRLISAYQRIIQAFADSKSHFSRIATNVNKDWRSIEAAKQAEMAESTEKEKEEEPTITIDNIAPCAHRIMFDSGCAPFLFMMLTNGSKDGDECVEYLRELLREMSALDGYFFSIELYKFYIDECKIWARMYFGDSYRRVKDAGLLFSV